MQTMHLFAGIGGGLLADLILGHTPIVAVEWDGYACQVLRERASDGWFPGLHVWEGDVRLFDPSEYAGKVDCIHAGFPCQPYSLAGRRAGIDDPRGGDMWNETIRCIRQVRPRYVFLENVPGFVSIGLPTILSDLAALGFDAEWLCLPASRVGANHIRDRWWLLAHPGGDGQQRGYSEQGTACGKDEAFSRCKAGRKPSSDASVDTIGREQSFGGAAGRVGREEQVSRYRLGEITSQPFIRRGIDVVPNRIHRLKGLGNAQVPLQAAVAWKLLGGP